MRKLSQNVYLIFIWEQHQPNESSNYITTMLLTARVHGTIPLAYLGRGVNPLISLALTSHPYQTIDRLVIKKLRHPTFPCRKTNIHSNTVLDVSPPWPPVSPQTTNSGTLQDREDVLNYRACVKRTKPGYPWRGKNRETSGRNRFYCCCQDGREEQTGSPKSIPPTESPRGSW